MSRTTVNKTEPRAIHPDDPGVAEAVGRLRRLTPRADPLSRLPDVHPAHLPRHVAIIMDGNGRWAKKRGFDRSFGHRNGAAAVRRVVEECGRLGVETLTLYSFSTDNWKRPSSEVSALMELCLTYCQGERDRLIEQNVRFRVIGRRQGLPERVLSAIDDLVGATSGCTGQTLCLALNYGAREEIIDAMRAIARDVLAGRVAPEAICEQTLTDRLYTSGLRDPDLLIRTAGEMRVSNFLLWQISYAELFVSQSLWPDFDAADIHEAFRAYAARYRRFGGLGPTTGQG